MFQSLDIKTFNLYTSTHNNLFTKEWSFRMKATNLSKRILYFDYLEVIAIFLVVSIHRPWFDFSYSASILSILCSICVPLFFMVNGSLLFHKTFDLKKHIHKIIAMFIALEGWRILYFLACLATWQVHLDTFSKLDLWNYLCGSVNLDHIPTAHMWFTNTLLFLYILFPLLKTCWDYNKAVLYFFTIICGCFFQISEEINVLLAQLTALLHKNSIFTLDGFRATLSPLSNNGHFLIYFVLGAILHDLFYIRSDKPFNEKKIRPYSIFCIVFGLLWNFLAKYLQCGTLKWTGESFKNGYLKIGTVFMCVGIFVLFSTLNFRRIPSKLNNAISFVSKRTLDIYYIHMFFAAIALDYIYPKLQIANVFINTVRTLLIMAIALIIGQLFRKLPILKHLLNA